MTKKQKLVKEAWCIESKSDTDARFIPISICDNALRYMQNILKCLSKEAGKTYRIRKWKAVTVCEIIKENRCAFKTGCGEFLPWIINYCPYCGGKIKVRK